MESALTAHIINHTHWDREWFLTSIYTSRWIAGLIDRLAELATQNPDFHFFFDGQTLVIEDLLQVSPRSLEQVERLIRQGNLVIGPYYCQPDWRLSSGESLIRNLFYGQEDGQAYGGVANTGWLVDTFGHISQSPQIHRMFGIDAVYIWRGAPRLEPFFDWQGADGSSLFTTNLFGGYRNLYGITYTPEIAVKRLYSELDKLAPYYPTGDIPLFDGYDLEDNPEDPVRFYRRRAGDLPDGLSISESNPENFAAAMQGRLPAPPAITGELIGGKYGAVFPGTLSSRIYLKVMARDCDRLLYQVCEPLGALASLAGRFYPAERYETWGRLLLQNAVHDCICGVSIDQVHEKMEFSYRQAFDGMLGDLRESLEVLLGDFTPGRYAVSANPQPYEGRVEIDGSLCHVKTAGIGVWPVDGCSPLHQPARSAEDFHWKNDYYTAVLLPDRRVRVGEALLGGLRVYAEEGDAYSEERGRLLGELLPSGLPRVEREGEGYCTLTFTCSGSWEGVQVAVDLRLFFDLSPLLRWQVALEGRGAGYCVEMTFDSRITGQVLAGMPFDIVKRPFADRDFLPRVLDPSLESVLLGQRELIENRTFPFQDFVGLSSGSRSAVFFARGLHAYRAGDSGGIGIPLNRSVEWLTRPHLAHRVGDAGPFFYVPDARGERRVDHELAAWISDGELDDARLQALNAGFQNPPLLVDVSSPGTRRSRAYFGSPLPVSSLRLDNGRILARLYNPTGRTHSLDRPYQKTDVYGSPEGEVRKVDPKRVVCLDLGEATAAQPFAPPAQLRLLNPPGWRVGPNQGRPDPEIIRRLKDKIADLEQQVSEGENDLRRASKDQRYLLQHRIYMLQRELLEYRLSVRLNEIKQGMDGRLTREYLYEPDEEVAQLGRELNTLRIKRRVYDYVVQAIAAEQAE